MVNNLDNTLLKLFLYDRRIPGEWQGRDGGATSSCVAASNSVDSYLAGLGVVVSRVDASYWPSLKETLSSKSWWTDRSDPFTPTTSKSQNALSMSSRF